MTLEPSLSSLIRPVHRLGHEPPPVIAQLGWRYHHIGIPTDRPRQEEKHLAAFGVHVSGFSSSPFGIEWMWYSADTPLHPAIKTLPHVLPSHTTGHAGPHPGRSKWMTSMRRSKVKRSSNPPGSPSEGVRAAMILVNGAPVELISFRKDPHTAA